jgi:transposase
VTYSKLITDRFAVLKNRLIVERIFAWLGNFRRLAKDVEILTGFRKYGPHCYAKINPCKILITFCQTASHNISWLPFMDGHQLGSRYYSGKRW